uniref:Uncharacterized protein n=1 Tax=Mus musculus TaxID=10090 RepID=Q6R5H5_MOUSE|nr:unknown [Mus musculus]
MTCHSLPGDFLTDRKHLAMSRNTSGCHTDPCVRPEPSMRYTLNPSRTKSHT